VGLGGQAVAVTGCGHDHLDLAALVQDGAVKS
jgi:hypothetical protein